MEKLSNLAQNWPENKNRYQIAFKYTKSKVNSTISALIRPNNKIAVIMPEKKNSN